MANAAAQELFDADEQLASGEHATFLMGRRERASDTMTLASGRVVQIRGTRIVTGSETAGLVVIARCWVPARCRPRTYRSSVRRSPSRCFRRSPSRRPRPGSSSGTCGADMPRSRAGRRRPGSGPGGAAARARRAGSDGRGRRDRDREVHLVAELFHADHPGGRSVSVDASQLDGGTKADVEALVAAHREQTLCIVRNIDQAGTEGVERLDELFTAIAAAAPPRPSPPRCRTRVSTPTCRSTRCWGISRRRHDPAATLPHRGPQAHRERVVEEVAPNRRVRLAPDAERVIARYSWPRNVSQLREASSTRCGCARRRDPAAGPAGYCHTMSRKSLTPLETAERDAIIARSRSTTGTGSPQRCTSACRVAASTGRSRRTALRSRPRVSQRGTSASRRRELGSAHDGTSDFAACGTVRSTTTASGCSSSSAARTVPSTRGRMPR